MRIGAHPEDAVNLALNVWGFTRDPSARQFRVITTTRQHEATVSCRTKASHKVTAKEETADELPWKIGDAKKRKVSEAKDSKP